MRRTSNDRCSKRYGAGSPARACGTSKRGSASAACRICLNAHSTRCWLSTSTPEVEDRVTFLRNLAAALKPGGRLGIVNYKPGLGGPGPGPQEGVRVDSASVDADALAAGLRVLASQELPYQYVLVLGQ